MQGRAGDPRKLQQIVDQQAHALGLGAHAVQVLVRLFVELAAVVLDDGQAPAIDAAEGSAEVVRNRIGKSFQFAVGRLELRRPLPHTVFEAGVQFLDLSLRQFALADIGDQHQNPSLAGFVGHCGNQLVYPNRFSLFSEGNGSRIERTAHPQPANARRPRWQLRDRRRG